MQDEITCKHELYPSFLCTLFYVVHLYLVHFLVVSSYGKIFSSFVYVNTYCVGAERTVLLFTSNGLDPLTFLSKEGKDAVYLRKS